jgi:hypothetical protein
LGQPMALFLCLIFVSLWSLPGSISDLGFLTTSQQDPYPVYSIWWIYQGPSGYLCEDCSQAWAYHTLLGRSGSPASLPLVLAAKHYSKSLSLASWSAVFSRKVIEKNFKNFAILFEIMRWTFIVSWVVLQFRWWFSKEGWPSDINCCSWERSRRRLSTQTSPF